jgi:hypothetical protein
LIALFNFRNERVHRPYFCVPNFLKFPHLVLAIRQSNSLSFPQTREHL